MSRRWFFTSLFAGFAVATAVLAVIRTLAPPPLNVLLLTVEGARAGIFSAETTPELQAAARSASRFTNHRTISAWTGPNVIAQLTGLSPFQQGVHTRGNSVAETWRLPLEDLADAGWKIGGLQAFMQVDVFRHLGLELDAGNSPLDWLAERRSEGAPFFLWYHYLGTHLPYAPSASFRPDWASLLSPGDAAARERIETVIREPVVITGTVPFEATDRPAVEALYRAGFREFDVWFASLWQFLGDSGLIDNTVVILTADHGEELLERGNVGHASTTRAGHLHEEIVRVPLLIWLPPRLRDRLPTTVDAPSDHLDIMPTVMEFLGVNPSRRLTGHSLSSLPATRPWSAVTSRAGYAEPDPDNLRQFLFAYLDQPWKLHLDRIDGREAAVRLYDITQDPGELTDLAATHRDIVARLRARLTPAILAMRPPTGPGASAADAAEAPGWIEPAGDEDFSYDDLGGRFRLRWSGPAEADYVVEYVAGTGDGALQGELQVRGPEKDFGTIARLYWDTWIVRYGNFRLRVRPAGPGDKWSPWITLKARP
jgi:choline-sulfatase